MASKATAATAAKETALQRGLRKTAVLDELYARLAPENGGHRPLTADEVKIQRDNALSVAELDAVQADLWGRYVATADLFIDGVLAFAAGNRVPHTHVDRYDWAAEGLVESVTPAPAADAVADGG